MFSQLPRFFFFALLVVTWPHFRDPPTGSEARDEPCVSTQQRAPFASPLFLFFVLVRFFVLPFVFFLAVSVSVHLFIFVASVAHLWPTLNRCYYYTRRYHTKVAMFLLLLMGTAVRLPFFANNLEETPPFIAFHKTSMKEFKEFAALAHFLSVGIPKFTPTHWTSRWMIRSYERARIQQMLLIMSGIEQ